MPLFSMLCLVRYNIKERVERMGTVEERLADLGFPVEEGEEYWIEEGTGNLYLHSPSAETIYMVDPGNKRFCHRGTEAGCFYTK